jgi:hypothetical protein
MNRTIIISFLIVVLIIASIWSFIFSYLCNLRSIEISQEVKVCSAILKSLVVSDKSDFDKKITEWHLFIDALIYVESAGREYIIGPHNDVGILQITPIFVEEVNRILGERKYTLEDRLDKYKSIEMFNVLNDKYNPERCFTKAIKLHNPRAGEGYRLKVLNEYLKLIN